MWFPAIFFTQLLVLFFLSRTLHQQLANFFYHFFRSQKVTMYCMAFLFFTGTLIHEIAHYLMAHLLFVPSGDMTLFPKLEAHGVKLGSVAIAKTDPIRRFFIGVAPLLLGLLVILGTLYITELYQLWGNTLYRVLIVIILFEISNTMFSSKKDMEGAVGLFIIIIIPFVLLYVLGVRLPDGFFRFLFSPRTLAVFTKGVWYLLIPLGIDLVLVTLLKLIHKTVLK